MTEDELLRQEPWRQLGARSPYAMHLPSPEVMPPIFRPGMNAEEVRANWAVLQEARKRNLQRDFDFMEAFQQTQANWVVINYKSLNHKDPTRGRYEVDTESWLCNCPDQFHTYAEEGSNLICKHLLFLALALREDDDA